MATGIFERKFGVSPGKFHSVSDINAFIEKETGARLLPSLGHGNGFVLPQGNVFFISDRVADDMVDSTIRDQGWLKKLISMK